MNWPPPYEKCVHAQGHFDENHSLWESKIYLCHAGVRRQFASALPCNQWWFSTEAASSLKRLNDGRRVLHVKVPGSQKRTSIAPFSRRVFRMITAIHPLHFPLLCASCFVRRIGYFRHVNLSLFLRNSTRTHIVCVFISLAVGQLSQRQLILLKIWIRDPSVRSVYRETLCDTQNIFHILNWFDISLTRLQRSGVFDTYSSVCECFIHRKARFSETRQKVPISNLMWAVTIIDLSNIAVFCHSSISSNQIHICWIYHEEEHRWTTRSCNMEIKKHRHRFAENVVIE